jgi:transposase InsO family protein
MYRLLADQHGRVRERRDQRAHPGYAKPELLATRPNELYSWDITKLLGPAKWTYYYLYVILDVFSRYAVGWTVQHRESAHVAKALISQVCEHQQIRRDQLIVHADRGSSMTSKPVALGASDFTLRLGGEPRINPTLLRKLEAEFGVPLAAEEFDIELIDATSVRALEATYPRLLQLAHTVAGFEITSRTVLGTFSYAKRSLSSPVRHFASVF